METPPPLPNIIAVDFGDLRRADYVPFSDLHIGDRRFNLKKFLSYRDWVLDADDRFCGINGDTFNAAIPGSKSSRADENLNMDQQLDLAAKIIRPLVVRKRLVVITDGNHDDRVSRATDGVRPGKVLAAMIGAPELFAGDGALVKISIGKGPNNQRVVYSLYHTHGWAAGRGPGNALNACRDLQHTIFADCYIVGHGHSSATSPGVIMVPDLSHNKIREKKVMFVTTGAFLSWGGYAQAKGYSPTAIGCPRIRLDGTRHDLHASV